ncbi:MAG: murein biosynthesis integral membrane protein MurJ [Rhizobacter sp.]|nr:murein biosynthesis integral membrane protein MurJ [Rhizobacter sp.]
MNLLRAASIVSVLTLASRITGLVRELIVAAMFGAGAWTDAFQAAFRIPNMLRRLFAEGAFSQAFVPLLGNTRARDGDEATKLLISAVATVLFWALLVTCVIGVLAAPVVVWLMASGLKEFDGAVLMTRWMFPYIGFISLVALSAGILNTWKHFAVPAASPVLLNVAVIAAAWWLSPWFKRWGIEPIYSLAAGVMLGGVLQLAVQLPALRRIGVLPRIGLTWPKLREAWHHPGVHLVLRQMAPALLGVSVAQLSLMINTHIASYVGVGAVSWLTYADRLMEFPTGLLGVALGVVLIPQLSAAQGKGDTTEYSAMLDWGLRLVMLLALPCAVALLVFAQPLVAVLYQRGAFTAGDVLQTQRALMAYGVGLLGLIAIKVLAPGFYARQDVRTPVKIAVSVLVMTQLLNLALVPWLGHAGLALSISLGAMINSTWLFIGLKRSGAYRPSPGWGAFALRVLLACSVLGGFLVWAAQAVPWIAMHTRDGQRIGLMAACLAAGVGLYFATLLASGLKFRQFMRRG